MHKHMFQPGVLPLDRPEINAVVECELCDLRVELSKPNERDLAWAHAKMQELGQNRITVTDED